MPKIKNVFVLKNKIAIHTIIAHIHPTQYNGTDGGGGGILLYVKWYYASFRFQALTFSGTTFCKNLTFSGATFFYQT